MTAVFTARFASRCASCDESIREGDLVTYGGTSVIHADCHDDVTDDDRALLICPACHLTKPCDCEGLQ